jgi:DNA-binding transcriptional ArsR family regulator
VVQSTAEARFFRVLGDPTRLRILQLLTAKPRTVSELVDATGVRQSTVSNHLACLRWCEFVDAERNGRHITYRVSDPRLGQLLETVHPLVADRVAHLASCRRIGPDWI